MLYEATSDHASIQFWAKVHGAQPAERLPTIVDGVQPVLCFLFNHSSQESGRVIPVSWDVFFERFDLLGLSFIGDMDTTAVPISYEIVYGADNPLHLSLLA